MQSETSNQDKPVELSPDTFERFVKRYRDTYGEQKMGEDVVTMWFEKLCHIESQQFENVTTMLLGNKNWAFKWEAVIEKVAIMFRTPENMKAEEETWKLEYDKNSNKKTKDQHAKILSCIPAMVARNPSGWREEYFKLAIDLMGRDECLMIADKIQGQFPEMKEWLIENNEIGMF